MSEGNHSAIESEEQTKTVEQHIKTTKGKLPLMLGGTAVAILAGGLLLQLLRGEPTVADVEDGATAGKNQQSGTARVRRSSSDLNKLARVNSELISWDMVARECMDRHGIEVLESMIDRLIIQQACQQKGVVVKKSEVDAEIIQIAKRFNLDPANWFQMLHAERKITPDQYRRNVIWPMLALRKLASEKIEVTDEDMRKGFVKLYGERVKARMIMLDNPRRGKEIWDKVMQRPEDFEQLARTYSIEPNSKALDGAMPPIRRFGGNETLEKAAFKLKEGEISGLIQTGPSQYVILLCEGRTEVRVEFDEVKATLHEQIAEEKIQESVARLFSDLKSAAVVDNYLTNYTSRGVRNAATKKTRGKVTPAEGIRTQPAPSRSSAPQRLSTSPKRLSPSRK